jgi:biopolymer transport protein ExbD
VRQPVSSVCALILSFAVGVATALQVRSLREDSHAADARLPSPSSLTGAAGAQPGSSRSCRALVVALDGRGSISLNDERLGTLDDPSRLVAELKASLREREAGRDDCPSVTLEYPPGPSVYVRAPRSLPYGDLAILLDAVEVSGAKSIKLSLEEDAQDF